MKTRMQCWTISASVFVMAGVLAVAAPASAQHQSGKDADSRNGIGQGEPRQGAAVEQTRLQPLSQAEKARRLARWITRDDYPVAARKARAEGSVRIAWKISILGFVTDCRVVESSGNADLDAASCDSLTRRGRYSPALDQYGMPIESQDSRTVHWVLPK